MQKSHKPGISSNDMQHILERARQERSQAFFDFFGLNKLSATNKRQPKREKAYAK